MWCAKAIGSLLRLGALAGLFVLLAAGWEFAAHANVGGRDFVIRSWERRDGGLLGSAISAIRRTPEGYLWLATERGLVRFDGVRFKLFNSENTAAFKTNAVDCLLVHSDGRLWVGTPAGLVGFRYGNPDELTIEGLNPDAGVKALAEGKRGTVWALLEDGEVVRISEGRSTPPLNAPDETFQDLISDGKGTVWAVFNNDLYTVAKGEWTRWWPEGGQPGEADVIAPGGDGGFWAASGWDVKFRAGDGATTPLQADLAAGDALRAAITVLLEDSLGRLWAGTGRGAIYCYQPDTGWQLITPRRARSQSRISSLYEDSDGSIWAGAIAGILHQIKPRRIATLSLPMAAQESISHIVHTVCVTQDRAVWVGTDGAGVYRWKDGMFSHFGRRQGLNNATVMAIFQERRGDLWFGTFEGLFRLEGGDVTAPVERVISEQAVPALFEDRAGDLWIGTVGAVIRKQGDEMRRYSLGRFHREFEVRAIAEGTDGEMWFGTRGAGLFRLRDGRIDRIKRFPRPVVNSLHCDSDGVLWIGTFARGLYSLREGARRNWMIADGLPSNTVFAIVEDESGMLWLSSDEGVFGVSKGALEAYSPEARAPMPVVHLRASERENWSAGSGQPAAAKGPNGRLWFPLGHGVMAFDPALFKPDRPAAPALVEEVLVDGIERVFMPDEPLRIRSGVRRLEFRFTLAELDAPGRQKFRYKLEGWDAEWTDAGGQRAVHYARLPPGRYQFRLLAAGSLGVWNEMASPLMVEIVPRIWEIRWIQVLSAFLLLGSVAGGVRAVERARFRRKMERLEMEEAMEKERRRIAQDLHDDLGAGLTEIMLLGEVGKGNGNGGAQDQLTTITEKARRLAGAMDEVVWTVDPKNDLLPSLATCVSDYAREFFRASSTRCRVDVAEPLPPLPLAAGIRHHLFLAIKEALNNAAKHSRADEVWLRFRCKDNRLSVIIEDDGQGFGPSGGHPGNGLNNMRARLDAAGGTAEIESKPGQGTTIRFFLPLRSLTVKSPG